MDTISLITRFVIIQITTVASHESLILPLATFTTRPIRSIHSRRNLPRGLEITLNQQQREGGQASTKSKVNVTPLIEPGRDFRSRRYNNTAA